MTNTHYFSRRQNTVTCLEKKLIFDVETASYATPEAVRNGRESPTNVEEAAKELRWNIDTMITGLKSGFQRLGQIAERHPENDGEIFQTVMEIRNMKYNLGVSYRSENDREILTLLIEAIDPNNRRQRTTPKMSIKIQLPKNDQPTYEIESCTFGNHCSTANLDFARGNYVFEGDKANSNDTALRDITTLLANFRRPVLDIIRGLILHRGLDKKFDSMVASRSSF